MSQSTSRGAWMAGFIYSPILGQRHRDASATARLTLAEVTPPCWHIWVAGPIRRR
jgi:hypothetical protein